MAAAHTSAPKPSPSATGLTKAQFVARMEAVCADTTARLESLPQPKNQQDLAGIAVDLQGILTLFPQYMAQADALVNRSADKATLTRRWLSLEKSDFAAFQPAVKKFLADVKVGNRAAVAADAQALDKLSDHSEAIASFTSGYGLKNCAELQTS